MVSAQVPVAELDALQPPGGCAGETVDLQVHGSYLEELEGVWVSDPEIEGAVDDDGRIRLAIPDRISSRAVDVSVYGRFGVSNPRVFVVGTLPEQDEEGDHHRREQAQVMEVGTTLNGTAESAAIDWYRVTPEGPEPLWIDVMAERLDSRMDPTVVILDGEGHELARYHDVRGRDVTVHFEPPVSGEPLFIGVHDFLYDGGTSYFYRLTVAREAVPCRIPKRDAADLPVVDLTASPMPYAPGSTVDHLPASMNGRCEQGQPHEVDLLVEEGGEVVVELFAERLGDPSDFRLRVDRIGDEGEVKKVGEADDLNDPVNDKRFRLGSRDPVVTFNAEGGVRYRVRWSNQFRTGGAYRLELRSPRPNVHLVAAAEKPLEQGNQLSRWVPVLRRGGTAHWEVLALRRDGFAGPIRVRAESLPDGLEAPEVVIKRVRHQVTFTVTAGMEAPAFAGPIELVGEATIGEETVTRKARGATLLWSIGDANRERWESRLTSAPLLAVLPQETEPIRLLPTEREWASCVGGRLEIPLKIERLLGQSGNFKTRLSGLPGLNKPLEASFDPNAEEVKFTLDLANKNNNKFAPGTYWIHARAHEGKVKHRTNPEAAERAEAERKAKEASAEALANRLKDLEAKQATPSEVEEVKKQLEAANQAKEAAAKQAEEAKKRAAPRELTHAFLSPPMRLRIDDGPLRMHLPDGVEVTAGATIKQVVTFERRYGFADAVEFTLSPPSKSKLFEAVTVSAGKDATEARLAVSLAEDLKPGVYEATLAAKSQVNGTELTQTRLLIITVVPSPSPSSLQVIQLDPK